MTTEHEIQARSVLHPTDFTRGSELAFAHALRIAVAGGARLTLLHCTDDRPRWEDFPGVRSTLERWGMLPAGAAQSDVFEQLGVKVEKAVARGSNVVDAIVGFMERRPVDTLVLATHGREGLPRWLKPSIAEPLARRAELTTLFVPHASRACVSLEDGSVQMDRVLVPVDRTPRPQPAVLRAVRAIRAFGGGHSLISLLHVGEEGDMPSVDIPPSSGLRSERLVRQGKPVEVILQTAEEIGASLIIMVTAGRDGFLDILRGSTTEQVLRRSPCPVLAIPVATD
ncbi:MAG: universal stress protein [Candidatus Latescibacterota bacterium]|nr:MAG: universal stress protein [Candidatus Latescibacterota bacterium]